MNIAFFTHYTTLYGANRSLIDLAEGLNQLGINPFLIAPCTGQITEYFKEKKWNYFVHPIANFLVSTDITKASTLERIKKTIDSVPAISNQLKRWSIDIVYTNSSVIDIGLICAKAISKPHIWHIREFGDLDYGLKPDIGRHLSEQLLYSSDALIFISKKLKDHILPVTEHKNINIIYNGVVSKNLIIDFSKQTKKKSSSNICKFSIIGRVTQSKGQHLAIKAFIEVLRKHPDTKLFIAGEGKDLNILKKIVYDAKLYDKILFLGEVIEPLGIFMNTDVALMCSEHEAMGRVTAEAMSCFCPIIGHNSGATPEFVTHGESGFLYNNTQELSHYINYMIENPLKTREMAANAQYVALNSFTTELYTKNILNVINSVNKSANNNALPCTSDNAQIDDKLHTLYYNLYKNLINT